ncbi:MAG: sugar phosphate isomerase/epimerase [Mariniblastus sp.]|jgi:sugar phosphate isomerase/epimerase
MSQPSVLLSGFADEAANQKTLDQQFSALAAIGMRYFSIRFVDAGNGVKNVMGLDATELETVKAKISEYGLNVSSLGSPIGKVKLCDVDDGTTTPYVAFDQYLQKDVPRACELANAFGSKLIRGFSFYHPKGSELDEHFAQATDQVGKIADVCQQHGLTYGLEVEANLVGQNGELLAKMHEQINQDALVLIFDGGNLVTMGYSADEVFQQYQSMKPGLGWLHIKDFLNPKSGLVEHVDEDALKHFVPADIGDSGHLRIFEDLAGFLPELESRMKARGVPGVFLDLEPHVKGGGQFGGFSGPDGFGVAMRALCRVCDQAGIGYQLREFSDIQQDRGF